MKKINSDTHHQTRIYKLPILTKKQRNVNKIWNIIKFKGAAECWFVQTLLNIKTQAKITKLHYTLMEGENLQTYFV